MNRSINNTFNYYREYAPISIVKLPISIPMVNIVLLFRRPVALTLPMSVSIDIRGQGGSPTLTTSRMNAYVTDTGSNDSSNELIAVMLYMISLLGWLETRLAQNTSNYINVAYITLTHNITFSIVT